MNPYEALANGIIEQAAKDHRSAAAYLKKHPRTRELEDTVAAQREARRKRRAERKKAGLKPGRECTTREERQLERIAAKEHLLRDTESFFLSDWISDLTEADGEWLLERIKKTEA